MVGPMSYSPAGGNVIPRPIPNSISDRTPWGTAPEGADHRLPARGGPTRSPGHNGSPSGGAGRDGEAAFANDESRLLALLADRTRLRILRILAEGERPVVGLTSELRLPQPTVSHHLAWLRMMDLVAPRRQGKHVFYSLGRAAEYDGQGTLTLRSDTATVRITPNIRA